MQPRLSSSRPNSSSGLIATDCGQPRAVGSFIGPSSIADTNSSAMKLSSRVVTTSSTESRVLSHAGTISSKAPAPMAAATIKP